MASADPRFVYRTPGPEVLERGRAQWIGLEVYDDSGERVVVGPGSEVRILAPGGDEVLGWSSVVIEEGWPRYQVAAGALPADLAFDDRYQIRWRLDLPGLADLVEVRRVCTVAPFAFPAMVAAVDLVEGQYPQLEAIVSKLPGVSLGQFVRTSQQFILRRMRRHGAWPEMIVDADALFDVVREYALYLTFRAAAAGRAGDGDRWRELRDEHLKAYEAAWSEMSASWDRDGDGLIDAQGKQAILQPIQIGGAPRARRRRDPRW